MCLYIYIYIYIYSLNPKPEPLNSLNSAIVSMFCSVSPYGIPLHARELLRIVQPCSAAFEVIRNTSEPVHVNIRELLPKVGFIYIRGTLLGIPIRRVIVIFWDLCGDPHPNGD